MPKKLSAAALSAQVPTALMLLRSNEGQERLVAVGRKLEVAEELGLLRDLDQGVLPVSSIRIVKFQIQTGSTRHGACCAKRSTLASQAAALLT
jgi:hypothetical protein